MTGTTLTAIFPHVTVISLKERTDRQAETRAELSRIGQDPDKVSFYLATRPAQAGPFQTIGVRGAFESHLAVLRAARDAAAPSLLVFEDDIAFAKDFAQRFDLLRQLPVGWDIYYGGHDHLDEAARLASHPPGNRKALPGEEFIGLHFYAVNGKALDFLVRELEAFLTRPEGHPDGWPMPVDGAINVIRRRFPTFEAYVAEPPLGLQRSSRSDIAARKWFDRAFLGAPVSALRRLKNRLRA